MARTLTKEECYGMFFKIRNNFNTSHEAAYTRALSTSDPVLRSIALYFAEYYNEAKAHCGLCDNCINCTNLCKYLNLWLNEKKALYTSHGKCEYNQNIWDEYIEKLWDALKGSENETSWCPRDHVNYKGIFPKEGIPTSCNSKEPIQFSIQCKGSSDSEHFAYVPTNTCTSKISTVAAAMGYFSPIGNYLMSTLVRGKRKLKSINEELNNHEFTDLNNNHEHSENSPFNVLYHYVPN
ncbi:PIR Superfamily Protein [Plasmodium ovale wallikeri]|uniref:PIR Superfamily Protein n=1 Tax=Plasmodium ovale wallikeri TaxID=864142 RepID=A0A1A9ALH6_PLAOA|nr:PIR Superfamily Protein [Plasmodium ovale wallikeri]SBT57044.1 PIR Superfamily Protein [Plasmodium ovale wallikeri]